MNKEEKDIEIVKEITFVRGIRKDVEGEREDLLALEEVLNLVDKLQKEIESKNKQIKLMQEMNLPKEIEINYISKDIIRDKIKELEEKDKVSSGHVYGCGIVFLKDLLGE